MKIVGGIHNIGHDPSVFFELPLPEVEAELVHFGFKGIGSCYFDRKEKWKFSKKLEVQKQLPWYTLSLPQTYLLVTCH